MHYSYDARTQIETVIIPSKHPNTEPTRPEPTDNPDSEPIISDVEGDYEARVSPRLLKYLLDSVKALQRG